MVSLNKRTFGFEMRIFSGSCDEKDGDEGAHFYRFAHGRFILLRTITKSPSG
jgi:hypothetical protein